MHGVSKSKAARTRLEIVPKAQFAISAAKTASRRAHQRRESAT
jgi:hypothetical protein